MTQGIGGQFLSALLRDSATGALRGVSANWFVEDEQAAYEFVLGHFRAHGQLPDLTTALGRFQLPVSPEPIGFYLERLKARQSYTRINSLHPGFASAMETRDMESVRRIIREMGVAASLTDETAEVTTFVEEAALLREHYEAFQYAPGNVGITLGYERLDELTDGAQPGDLILIVARPGVGKTYLLLNMMRAARDSGEPSVFVSMEMGSRQIMQRLAGMDSGINTKLIRRRQLSLWGRERFFDTLDSYEGKAPTHVMQGNLRRSVDDVDNLLAESGASIGYLDAGYLIKKRMQGHPTSRREVISDVVEELKEVALARGVALVVTVQFNRTVKRGTFNQNLDLGSIGETDVLGQVGSIIVGMQVAPSPHEKVRRYLKLLKNREGDEGDMMIRYEFQPMNFDPILDNEMSEAAVDEAWQP